MFYLHSYDKYNILLPNMVLLEVTKIKYLYFPETNFVSPNVLCSVNTVLAPLKTVYLSRIFRFLILSTI